MAMCRFIRMHWDWEFPWNLPQKNKWLRVETSCQIPSLREKFLFWQLWHLYVFIPVCGSRLIDTFTVHLHRNFIIIPLLKVSLAPQCSEYNLRKSSDHLQLVCVFCFLKIKLGLACAIYLSCLFMNSMVLESLEMGI